MTTALHRLLVTLLFGLGLPDLDIGIAGDTEREGRLRLIPGKQRVQVVRNNLL